MCSCSKCKGHGKSHGCGCNDCNRDCRKGCGCGKKKDCCYDDCCDRVEKVESLCVTCRLQVNGASKLKGTTQVDKLCFSDKSSPKDCKKWCVQELGTSMLGFQYEGAPQVRMTKTGVVLQSLETLTARGGNTNVDPDAEKATTVICITGDSQNVVSGTLADGKYDGQMKNIAIAKALTDGQYMLTIQHMAPAGNSETIQLGLTSAASLNGSMGISFVWSEDRWIPLGVVSQLE